MSQFTDFLLAEVPKFDALILAGWDPTPAAFVAKFYGSQDDYLEDCYQETLAKVRALSEVGGE